mgnify:CR=1 FL=1
MANGTNIAYDHANVAYGTPPELVAQLEEELGVEFSGFDPCPMPRPDGFDGLRVPWGVRGDWVFVNPPYNETKSFAAKAFAELDERGVRSCLLIPARMENLTWQGLIIPRASRIYVLRYGTRFVRPDGTPCKRPCPMTLAAVVVGDAAVADAEPEPAPDPAPAPGVGPGRRWARLATLDNREWARRGRGSETERPGTTPS